MSRPCTAGGRRRDRQGDRVRLGIIDSATGYPNPVITLPNRVTAIGGEIALLPICESPAEEGRISGNPGIASVVSSPLRSRRRDRVATEEDAEAVESLREDLVVGADHEHLRRHDGAAARRIPGSTFMRPIGPVLLPARRQIPGPTGVRQRRTRAARHAARAPADRHHV